MSALRIIVFAKAPRPGLAKTRLIPALGAAGAAALAARMLAHTLDQALASDVGAVELCVAPAPGDAVWQGVELPEGLALTAQAETEATAQVEAIRERFTRRITELAPDAAGLVRQQAFFANHLALWAGELATALEAAPESLFYSRSAPLLRAFFDIERLAFDML